jgi:hypothetical protein
MQHRPLEVKTGQYGWPRFAIRGWIDRLPEFLKRSFNFRVWRRFLYVILFKRLSPIMYGLGPAAAPRTF